MRLIDADALMQSIPSEEMIAKMTIARAPTITTKQIKYFDEDEKVWKTGDEYRIENCRLKERIKELKKACDNYDQVNCKLSCELNEVRWQLVEAKRRIEELEGIAVDWEVAYDDEARG